MGDLYVITRPNDETVEFWLNGVKVGYADHDEHGWAGMECAERMFHNMAAVKGRSVIEE